MGEVVRLFSTAFQQTCALKEAQRLGIDSFVQTRPATFVETIEPAKEALSMEGIVRLFSAAFKQICGLQEVNELVLKV